MAHLAASMQVARIPPCWRTCVDRFLTNASLPEIQKFQNDFPDFENEYTLHYQYIERQYQHLDTIRANYSQIEPINQIPLFRTVAERMVWLFQQLKEECFELARNLPVEGRYCIQIMENSHLEIGEKIQGLQQFLNDRKLQEFEDICRNSLTICYCLANQPELNELGLKLQQVQEQGDLNKIMKEGRGRQMPCFFIAAILSNSSLVLSQISRSCYGSMEWLVREALWLCSTNNFPQEMAADFVRGLMERPEFHSEGALTHGVYLMTNEITKPILEKKGLNYFEPNVIEDVCERVAESVNKGCLVKVDLLHSLLSSSFPQLRAKIESILFKISFACLVEGANYPYLLEHLPAHSIEPLIEALKRVQLVAATPEKARKKKRDAFITLLLSRPRECTRELLEKHLEDPEFSRAVKRHEVFWSLLPPERQKQIGVSKCVIS